MFRCPLKIECFYKFIGNLKLSVIQKKPTETHNFIRLIFEHNDLIRLYTQNIDGLEDVYSDFISSEVVVKLHGDLENLICTKCFQRVKFNRS